MKFAHLADVHLGHRQYNDIAREDDMYQTFRTTAAEIADAEVDVAAIAGDLFHNKDVDARVLDDAENVLSLFEDEGIPVVAIEGNHDSNLYAQSMTWLEYLHHRGKLVLLEADLQDETAYFEEHDPAEPGESSGYVDIDGTRFFGLQYRGQHITSDLERVADGIERVNEEQGDPDATVLLGHFGVEGHVPGMGANARYEDLRPISDVVDYLAIGHVHKRFEHNDWVYNPGSLELHSTREQEWDHGYYLVDVDADGIASADHHLSKRRPFYRFEFQVDEYGAPSELVEGFEEAIRDEVSAIREVQQQDHFTARGEPRDPVIDLRIEGLLQFDRMQLDVDDLVEHCEEITGALRAEPTTNLKTVEVQELLDDIENEDDVWKDGKLNKGQLEGLVFERIAEQSQYSDEAEDVANVLASVKRSWRSGESPADLTETVKQRRRDLFPDRGGDGE